MFEHFKTLPHGKTLATVIGGRCRRMSDAIKQKRRETLTRKWNGNYYVIGDWIESKGVSSMSKDNAMQIFSFEDQQVRVIDKDGAPWWIARDVCEVLGYKNSSKAIDDHVDDDDLTNRYPIIDGMGRKQEAVIINESGLYSLILSSKLPNAKKFKHFVTSEVLPALRKTGEYATPDKQREKVKKSDELAAKRLEIAEKNANWRMAKLVLEGIDKFKDVMTPESKTVFMAKYAELTAGHDMTYMLPEASEKWYSATDIGKICGVSSAKIGRVSNQNGIKAPEGKSNEYGTWIRSKSPSSPKELMTWVYYEKAVEWFKKYFGVTKTA
jgi:prophage antirepressor-like protein